MLQRRQMKTAISGRGFLGLPQRGISFTSQPQFCRELSEPSANSSFDSWMKYDKSGVQYLGEARKFTYQLKS
jgi:hypothetical protein